MRHQRGFTLIEVLVALTVFAMIASIIYAAVGPAGKGFRQLSRARDSYEKSQLVGNQLRADVAYASGSYDKQLIPLQLKNDDRGTDSFDRLTLLVREPGRDSLTLVRYSLDEEKGELVRESRMAWARNSVTVTRWEMGKASSLSIEAMDAQGVWHQHWPLAKQFVWPKALRIRLLRPAGERDWLLPVPLGDAG